jgi:PAS domain S-box-containing protein
MQITQKYQAKCNPFDSYLRHGISNIAVTNNQLAGFQRKIVAANVFKLNGVRDVTPGKSAPVPQVRPERPDVAQALIESQFVPFFQPLVTLRTGQLAGFEVLSRWQHPVEGLIPPARFIPVAERDGWIGELTRQILRKAFVAAAVLPDPLSLHINVSPVQLLDISLPEQIGDLAGNAGFPLSRIVIEITESALIENMQSAASIVAELKHVGCHLALDDFGTGYSSLTHLQALPFDTLKVDRRFVGSMTEKRESRKIVSAVVGLGQSLGLATVAEGIETQEQAEMILWLGCQLGQGYFYGHPLPAEELPACVVAKRGKLPISEASTARRTVCPANLDLSPTQRLAQLQAVYEGAPVGLALLDQSLRYVNLNQKLADMNGATIQDHMGAPVSEMIPGLFPYVEPYLRRALDGEPVTDVEAQLPETGETRLLSYRPVSDEAGEVIGVSVAVTDITKRKRMEEELARREAHYRSMVELNPQMLWIMDPQGRNLDISPRWDKMTGQLNSQSTEYEWLRSIHPADVQPTVRSIAESRRRGTRIDVRYRVCDGQGIWRWKRSRGSPRFDGAGNIVCWYGSVEDISAAGQPAEEGPRAGEAPAGSVQPVAVTDPLQEESDDERRSRALNGLQILDTPAEAEFDDLVALASDICRTPISLVTLVDRERQWFKAAVGLTLSETAIQSSFCIHAIRQRGLFVVKDATKDKRFERNPLVLGHPHIRFYAGIPIYAGDGCGIGALCVIDTTPRSLLPAQVKALTILSHQVQTLLELRFERRKNGRDSASDRRLAPIPLREPPDSRRFRGIDNLD